MDISQFTKALSSLAKEVTVLSKLLAEIARLDIDRASNMVTLQARIAKLETHIASLKRVPEVVEQLHEWSVGLGDEVAASRQEQARRFGVELERELRTIDVPLSGHYPDLHAGVYTITIDADKWKAVVWYGPKQEQLGVSALSAGSVASAVEQARASLGSSTDEEAFAQLLGEALSRVGHESDSEGFASIISVLGELALLMQSASFRRDPRRQHFRDYSRADYSFDLYRYGRRVQLRTATRAHSRTRDTFLWVPSSERTGEGAVYSHIRLRKETP